jgi:hypothetical protein
MEELRGAHKEQGKLESLARVAISQALLGVAEKYQLPKDEIEEFMRKGSITSRWSRPGSA